MSELSDQQLREMIRDGESDRVEFKESLKNKETRKQIEKAICAFANDLPDHGEPGFVIVGVRDKGGFSNLSVTDKLLRQLGDMKSSGNILPLPTMTVTKRVLDGNEVAVVKVEPSDSPPVRCRGTVYIRIWDQSHTASAQDVRILTEKGRSKDIPFDIQPMPTARLSDLDMSFFEHGYLQQAFASEILEANNRSLNEQLAAAKMIVSTDDPTPTTLGILTLGKNPQDFLPGAHIVCLRINGKEYSDKIIDANEIRGTISDQISRLEEKLNAYNRVEVDILSGPKERRTYTYPIEAIQQITRNAVMHRTYDESNAPTRVYWFNDRIQITSPGGPVGQVTPENFGQPDITAYRNLNLAEAMRNLRYVQKFGFGISLAQEHLQKAGHPPLSFKVDRNNVQVTIKAKEAVWFPSHEKSGKDSVPILTFFNNKGGVGKTSLVYHLAWMLSDMGRQVLACDLDPQSNLTSMFISEDRMEQLLLPPQSYSKKTVYNALEPLWKGVGDVDDSPYTEPIGEEELSLLVGDLRLSSVEDELSEQWPKCLDDSERAFRVTSALWRILQSAAKERQAEIALVDVGPNMGALNRAALVATDYIVVPLGAGLFSLQGLRNLGPTLDKWRKGWAQRRDVWQNPEVSLPEGRMLPIGYVVQQHGVRLNRPVRAYEKWVNRMPKAYAQELMGDNDGPYPETPEEDTENALATVKHYRSLVPMAQEARKPIFHLKPADGAIGSHAAAARDASKDFRELANKIIAKMNVPALERSALNL